MANKPGIRGYRNLGILASYVLVVVFSSLLVGKRHWQPGRRRSGRGRDLHSVGDFSAVADAARRREAGSQSAASCLWPIAWPIMAPEAVEYMLADLGVLRDPSVTDDAEIGRRTAVTITRLQLVWKNTEPAPEEPDQPNRMFLRLIFR